jgi:DNA mismatch repair protein MSH6
VEKINVLENFPNSTAVDLDIRKTLQRRTAAVKPWDVDETIAELHRRGYYPRGSRKENIATTSRWPSVLRAAVEGRANLAVSSFGAALFYLQRSLIDEEILSMNIVKAYIPPPSPCAHDNSPNNFDVVQSRKGITLMDSSEQGENGSTHGVVTDDDALTSIATITQDVENVDHMALDGKTLQNLEILATAQDHKVAGSLWSKINFTKTPHGSRLLRAWLLRPLYRKVDIDRRADAVQELVSGAAAVSAAEASDLLSKCGDIERLLSRVHSMSGSLLPQSDDDGNQRHHPNDRAVLYENSSYTKRKVGDFSRLLNSLRLATQIPELFAGVEIRSPLLLKILRTTNDGGCFPVMSSELDWFFDNFDCDLAAKGLFEPSKGIDQVYDDACDDIDQIQVDLEEYQNEVISMLTPRALAKSSWKYINTKPDSKDKYLIELSAGVNVPEDFILKGKR